MTTARVAALYIYPIKGCRGLAVDRAMVATTGLVVAGAGDREWMLVEPSGQFVTQRTLPRLALVSMTLADDHLLLHAPGCTTVSLPLSAPSPRAPARDVVVWQSAVRGFDEGDEVSAWFSSWLGTALRLVRFDAATPRASNPDFVGDTGAHTKFSDGYPLLVIGQSSLDDLNERLRAVGSPELPMNRFRPNVVLADVDPYTEDHLDTIAIGGVQLRCVKPCVRCQVTTTDQDTCHVGLEPLRTLGEYRMNETLGGATFGMNSIVTAGAGRTIALGEAALCNYRF